MNRTTKNYTVSAAGILQTDADSTVELEVELKSPRERKRVRDLIRGGGTNQRQSSAEKRGRMEKSMHAEGIIYANTWHVR